MRTAYIQAMQTTVNTTAKNGDMLVKVAVGISTNIIDCTRHSMQEGSTNCSKYYIIGLLILSTYSWVTWPNGSENQHCLLWCWWLPQICSSVLFVIFCLCIIVIVLHWVEHYIFLFFAHTLQSWHLYTILYLNTIRSIPCLEMIQDIVCTHIFMKQYQDFNNGWQIGLVKTTDTCMASYFYAFGGYCHQKDPWRVLYNLYNEMIYVLES